MDEGEIVHRASLIIGSEQWWRPVIGYLVTNSGKFSGYNFTNEENDCFVAFGRFFSDLFENFLCDRVGVKSLILEAAILHEVEKLNPEGEVIAELLRNYADFLFFRDRMLEMGRKIQDESTGRMLQVRRSEERLPSLAITQLLEDGEVALIDRETERTAREMRALLKIDSEGNEEAPVAPPAVDGLKPLSAEGKLPDLKPDGSTGSSGRAVDPIVKPVIVKK
jgi:hypothetical protein